MVLFVITTLLFGVMCLICLHLAYMFSKARSNLLNRWIVRYFLSLAWASGFGIFFMAPTPNHKIVEAIRTLFMLMPLFVCVIVMQVQLCCRDNNENTDTY